MDEICTFSKHAAIVGKPLSYIIDSPAVLGAASDIIAGAESARVEVQIKAEVWIGCHVRRYLGGLLTIGVTSRDKADELRVMRLTAHTLEERNRGV